MPQNHQKKILFIDIETVAGSSSFQELDPLWQTLWEKKALSLKAGDPQVNADELYEERGAIYAEFGKVVVIGLGYFLPATSGAAQLRVTALYNQDENALLTTFQRLLNEKFHQGYCLCAHNGKEFDYPYLCRRMLVNGISLPELLKIEGKKPWEIPHLDTLEMWKFGDRKSFTSLQLLTALFGIPSPKDDIDGSMVNEVYYQSNDLERIARYCMNDVVATAQLYRKLYNEPLIPDGAISLVDFVEAQP